MLHDGVLGFRVYTVFENRAFFKTVEFRFFKKNTTILLPVVLNAQTNICPCLKQHSLSLSVLIRSERSIE
jgi:hypothetical protein